MKKILRAVLRKTRSYDPILLIFNSKHGVAYGYNLPKFGYDWAEFTAMRVPHAKFKMVADDVIKLIYPKSVKKVIGPCPRDYKCEVASKSAQPFRLYS